MRESTTVIAFDQHAASVVAAVLPPDAKTPATHPVSSDLPASGRFVARLQDSGPVRCCYEAGPCGFALQRFLTAHGIACGAVGDPVPRRRADPHPRADRAGRSGARLVAVSGGYPRGSAARASSPGEIHVATWPPVERHPTLVETSPQLAPATTLGRRRPDIDVCVVPTAAELGDPRRFDRASRVMGYTGLVPSEHSSGSTRQQGHITKTGNAHLRRVLIEAAWHYRHRPALSPRLKTRHQGAPATAVACAWAAQHRLHRRYCRLLARGKRPQAVATAIARELAGFVWAALTQ